jgi:hypothetical protein
MKKEKIKPVLDRPSAQGHRPNGAAARLALLVIRLSGSVRVAQPLGLVPIDEEQGSPCARRRRSVVGESAAWPCRGGALDHDRRVGDSIEEAEGREAHR